MLIPKGQEKLDVHSSAIFLSVKKVFLRFGIQYSPRVAVHLLNESCQIRQCPAFQSSLDSAEEMLPWFAYPRPVMVLSGSISIATSL